MKSQSSHEYAAPPVLFEKFLNWCLPKPLKEPVIGDLAEEFSQKVAETRLTNANLWYMRQAVLTSIQYMWKTKRGMMMFVLGILAFIGSFLMALVMSAEISTFINVPSIIVVVPAAVFFAIGIASKETTLKAFRLLFDDEMQTSMKELNAAKHVFSVLGNTSLWLGLIGLVIGMVAIAENAEVETFTRVIGPATAVCLLTVLYALFIKVLCYAAEQKIQHLIINAE